MPRHIPHSGNFKDGSAPIRRISLWILVGVFFAWIALIGGRLVMLQVFEHSKYVELARHQQLKMYEVAPRRGVLYDRNQHEFATTVLVDSIYAVPSELGDTRDTAAAELASVVHTDAGDNFSTAAAVDARLNASRAFAWVARRVDADTAGKVMALGIKGVYTTKEFKRFYPDDQLAAQVLGYVGTDDTGLGGIELQFDDELHGAPGRKLTAVDARRKSLSSVEREPEPGENLTLTIDQNIQFIAERALDEAMARTHALRATAVVQDPHTGQILALAVRPSFSPNSLRHSDPSVLQNSAISNVYEPGSTFKLVTYSAALDAAGVKPTDLVDCQGGVINLYGRLIHDDKSDMGMGTVTVQRALEKSSDVAAVKMALKLGPEKFWHYANAFGFGSRTGIELPSETRGLLRPVRRWGATSIGSIAIGQEVGVTPVQLVTMVSAIANGGTYLPAHILMSEQDGKPHPMRAGTGVPNPLPDGAHRVISELTSAEMRKMMQGIVLEGTGTEARLNGYSSGGKTGTAQKIDVATHTYSKTKHVASFAGMAPVSNPAITVAVVIDQPEGNQYGGTVSAPVFREIAQQTLEYLGVPYDEDVQATPARHAKPQDVAEDEPQDGVSDVAGLLAEVNDLPKDDPLRQSVEAQARAARPAAAVVPAKYSVTAATSAAATEPATPPAAHVENASLRIPTVSPAAGVIVPVLTGKPLRAVVELAAGSGLRLQASGSGMARAQAPAAGAHVPPGTPVVVQFAR